MCNHATIQQTLSQILAESNIKFVADYADERADTSYPVIDGKSIKFWNIFPISGENLDRAVLRANDFLRPLGYFLAYHNFIRTSHKLANVTVPTKHGRDVRTKGYVQMPQPVMSLLVKPIPASMR